MRCLGLGLLSLLCAAAVGCGEAPTADQCQKLYEHTLNLHLKGVGVKLGKLDPGQSKDIAEQRKRLKDWIGKDFLTYCEQDLPLEGYRCGMKAKTTQQLEACDSVGE